MKTQYIVTVAKFFTFAAAASFGLLSSSPAFAGSATSSMSVSASVSDNCTISAGALSFGSYDPGVANASTPLDGSGSISVLCTLDASASIELGQGSNADAGSLDATPLRRLSDGAGNYLSYELDQDVAHLVLWGNTSGSGVGHTGTGASESIAVYGRIAAAQNVPSGSFTDTVVATINF
jgi:spore coat protein U-like protein